MSVVVDVFEFVKQNPGKSGQEIKNQLGDPYVSSILQRLEADGLIEWNGDGYRADHNQTIEDSKLTLEEAIDEAISAIRSIKLSLPKECPRCHFYTQGIENIEQYFGFRNVNGKTIPQSHCKKCRLLQLKFKQSISNYEKLIFYSTKEAKNLRRDINIKGTLIYKGPTKIYRLKAGGLIQFCSARLQDSSGDIIKLNLWGSETTKIKPYSRLMIINGITSEYQGEISLSLGKFGKLIILDDVVESRQRKTFKMSISNSSEFSDTNWIVDEECSYMQTNNDKDKKFQDFKF